MYGKRFRLLILILISLVGWKMYTRNREIDILARTLWGEARGEGRSGMVAVAAVIANRVKSSRWPNTFEAVCKQPWQFSMWNEGDPNGRKAMVVTDDDAAFVTAKEIATAAVDGYLLDPTNGANHYHTDGVNPYWNKNMDLTAQIGSHKFWAG